MAIGIFIKRAYVKQQRATVRHTNVWGAREVFEETDGYRVLAGGKYHWLLENDIKTTAWTMLEPQSPYYLFIPQGPDLRAEYQGYFSITEIMPVNSWGIKTRKDYLLVDYSRDVITQRFKDISRLSVDEAIEKYGIREAPHWSFAEAKKKMSSNIEEGCNRFSLDPSTCGLFIMINA